MLGVQHERGIGHSLGVHTLRLSFDHQIPGVHARLLVPLPLFLWCIQNRTVLVGGGYRTMQKRFWWYGAPK